MAINWLKYVPEGVDWSEHYIKRGNPAAPTYYIIRRRACEGVGLFSNYVVFAGHIRYALTHGYIPVVDLQNYPNSNLEPELIGKENAWEYYFEQPLRVDLEHAYAGENVLLSSGEVPGPFPSSEGALKFLNDKDGILTEWRMLVKLGLLKIKPQLQKEIDNTYNALFAPGDRVLGVKLRGTDAFSQRAFGHPIPPPWNLHCCTSPRKSKSGTAIKFSCRPKINFSLSRSKLFSARRAL